MSLRDTAGIKVCQISMLWNGQINSFPKLRSQSDNVHAHRKAWKSLYDSITRQQHNVKKNRGDILVQQEILNGIMQQQFRVPQVQASSRQNFIEALENPPLEKISSSRDPLLAMAEYQGAVMGKYVHKLE